MTKSTTPQTRANLKSTSNPKREPKPEGVDVSTLGRNQTYNGYTFAERGAGYSNPVGPVDNMGVGPGANRDVHRSGSQHGLAAPVVPPPGRPFDE